MKRISNNLPKQGLPNPWPKLSLYHALSKI